MSIFDQQPSNMRGCFGFSVREEDSYHDLLKQQHSLNSLTREDEEKKKEVDDLLSEAFNELTFEERQRQQEVLHGVDDNIAVEATCINSALQELDNHLLRIKRGSAYEIAERMDPEYVSARAFRVMFLRGNEYNAKKSASQMLRFFEMKQKLFGVEKLVKDITLEDLDEDDRASLNTGWLHLHGKDRSGRVVYIQFSGLRAFKDLRNELRGKFYFFMSLLRSEETQLKGVVGVMYSVHEFKDKTNGMGYFENVQVSLAIPVYTAGVHTCCSDVREYALFNLALKVRVAVLVQRYIDAMTTHFVNLLRLCPQNWSREIAFTVGRISNASIVCVPLEYQDCESTQSKM